MFAATRRWVRRNRTGLAIGAAVVGGTYMVGQYIVSKLQDAKERSQFDQISKDNIRHRFEQNQIDCNITVLALLPSLTENILEALPAESITQELQQKKAERVARGVDNTAQSEVSSLRDGETISLSSFTPANDGSFLHTSQLGQSQTRPRKTKAQLWNELKITSITRAMTLIYSISLLTLLTRIQLNLLGRLNYLSSVLSLSQVSTSEQPNNISLENREEPNLNAGTVFGNDFETNRRFLTFSWFLLHRGYRDVLAEVRTAVEEVFDGISPTEAISQQRLSELVMQVRRKVEGETDQARYGKKWLRYLLPDRKDEAKLLEESGVLTPIATSPDVSPNQSRAQLSTEDLASGPLRRLLDECADLIDNITFTRLHTQILDTLFSHLIDKRIIPHLYPQSQISSPPPSDAGSAFNGPRIVELDSSATLHPQEPRVKLANILAQFTRQAHVLANHTESPNEYLAVVEQEVKELDSFAVVIYTSNLREEAERSMVSKDLAQNGPRRPSLRERADQLDEAIQSEFEGAWEKVAGSAISTRQ